MTKYELICDRMDELAMRNLRVSNDLIRLKVDLDARLRDGWLSLAKTRFVAGYHRFGSFNFLDVDALDIAEINDDPQIVVDLTASPIIGDSKDEQLRSEFNSTKFTVRIDAKDVDQKAAKEEMERRLLKKLGALSPPSLKQSQRTFGTVLELVCEIVSVESELKAIVDEFKRLLELKAKFSNEH